MNITQLLDQVPLWAVFLTSLTITSSPLSSVSEQAARRRQKLSGKLKIEAGPLVADTVSLVAFMLAPHSLAFNKQEQGLHVGQN